jgi:hypothetical protein
MLAETEALAYDAGVRISVLERENRRLTAALAEEKRQHDLTAQSAWTWKQRIDELCRQLGLPPDGAPLPFPPVTIIDPQAGA